MKNYALFKPLPELEDQIKFIRTKWELTNDGKETKLSPDDHAMIEAILQSLCAVRWLDKKQD